MTSPDSKWRAVALVGLLLAGCGESGSFQKPEPSRTEPAVVAPAHDDSPWPGVALDEGFVGSDSCKECHERNHESWYASYHRRMTQAATPEAVLAPFEGNTPFDTGASWALERQGDSFYATPVAPDGRAHMQRMKVVLTTGSHHYQMYWLASEELGGLLGLPFVWHVGDQAWLTRRSQFLTPPHLETAFEFDRWPAMCIKCHTTNGTPEHEPSGAPRVAELGISCEACHGPGEEHVTLRRTLAASGNDAPPASDPIVNPASLSHERSAMVCGQCHAIHPFRSAAERELWQANGFDYRPGDDLSRTRELLRGLAAKNSNELNAAVDEAKLAELFWSDGEVRVSGREYNGLVESPCFQRGTMDCLSCHSMHPSGRDPRPLAEWAADQLAPGMDGPAACTQCHGDFKDEARLRAHTRHAPTSSGSDCMNCHMPYTTYGLTKAIRSHTITSPDVAATVATGRPNACNACHLDRTLGWTADHLRDWYGHERPKLDAEHERTSAAVLAGLAGDAGERALTAWALGWEPAREASGTGWMPYLVSLLVIDNYDAVSRVALATARLDPRYEDLSLDYTLRDARRLAPVMETLMVDWQRDGLKATDEQRAAVLVRADGTLDNERLQALTLLRDERDVRLAE